ncbi:MAG: hypothetical protein ABR582_13710 [Gemmatimonadaceae bacterium]
MADNDKPSEPTPPAAPAVPGAPGVPGAPPVPPKRSPGHRGADVKDTVAEMAAKAHEISLEAGSKMAAAMKDVINAAAGLSGFVIESARDLVQYMVRRGQMTQEEADKLIREVEAALPKKKPVAASHASAKSASQKPSHASAHPSPTPAKKPQAKKPAPKKAAPKKAAPKKAPAKKPVAKKPAPKKSAPAKSKKSAKKSRR